MVRRLFLLFGLSALLTLTSCDKFVFQKTQSGRNSLAFALDGKDTIRRDTYDPNGIYGPFYPLAQYYIGENGDLCIEAYLSKKTIKHITIKLPGNIRENKLYQPEIELTYLYAKAKCHVQDEEPGEGVEWWYQMENGRWTNKYIVEDKPAEWRTAKITDAFLKVRFYDSESHILAGNFFFAGECEDEVKGKFSIKGSTGVFDVKLGAAPLVENEEYQNYLSYNYDPGYDLVDD